MGRDKIIWISLFILNFSTPFNSLVGQTNLFLEANIGGNYLYSSDSVLDRGYTWGESGRIGIQYGAMVKIDLSPNFYVELGVNYFERHYNNSCVYKIQPTDTSFIMLVPQTFALNGHQFGCTHNLDRTFKFLSVPINIGYNFHQTNNMIIRVGVGWSPLIQLEVRNEFSPEGLESRTFYRDQRLWYAHQLSCNLEYRLWQRIFWANRFTLSSDDFEYNKIGLSLTSGVSFLLFE